MPGARALSLSPLPAPKALHRTWPVPVVITGLGGAVEGPLDLPAGIAGLLARAPFDAGLPAITDRAPGARALLVAMGRTIAHPDAGSLPRPERRAIVVGTRTAALPEVTSFIAEVQAVGASLVNPGLFPLTVMNAATGLAAIQHDCKGPNLTLNNGATSALDAIAYAADLVAAGQTDVAFAGGFEVVGSPAGTPFGRSGPPAVVAVIVALSTLEHAVATGGRASARLLSYGSGELEAVLPDVRPALSPAGPGQEGEREADRMLLGILEAAQRAGAAPAALLATGPEGTTGAGLLLGPVEQATPARSTSR